MRNRQGLRKEQIDKVEMIWKFLTDAPNKTLKLDIDMSKIVLDTTEAHLDKSETYFAEQILTIKVGADVYPGTDKTCANSRMSPLACLSHEFAHLQRFLLGFDRPFIEPNMHLDEAETSIHASFTTVLGDQDRTDLIEDAELRLDIWKGII